MRHWSMALVVVIVLAFGTLSAHAQSCEIVVDSVTNSSGDTLVAGNTHTAYFHVRALCEDPGESYNMAIGFKLFSPDLAGLVDSIQGERLPAWTSLNWGLLDTIFYRFKDGGSGTWIVPTPPMSIIADDTAWVGFLAAGLEGFNMPAGYDNEAWTVSFRTHLDDTGKHVCLDSAEYDPGFEWLWAHPDVGEIIPEWSGPYCFEIVAQHNQPPVIDSCPPLLEVQFPDFVTFDFDATDPESDEVNFYVVSGPGTIETITGMYYYAPPHEEEGFFTVEICASDAYHTCPTGNECTFELLVHPADVDNDGVADFEDNCPWAWNQDQEDTDVDSVGDSCDVCIYVYNPDQEDADNDEVGDSCDTCTDTDNDGYGNPGFPLNMCPDDNCPTVANADQNDADGDGIGDACDTCTDIDGDGYGDPGYPATTCTLDNCPEIFNPSQEDQDGDGKGDSCDVGDVEFMGSPRCGSRPLTVTFTDLSAPIDTIMAWHWEFGDGVTSDDQTPVHDYDDDGAYDVLLAVSDGVLWDTLILEEYIIVQDSVVVDFTALPTTGNAPLTVVFDPILEGTANSFLWLFGDETASFLPNPIHTYDTVGIFDVTLIVELDLGPCYQTDTLTKTAYIGVTDLRADFLGEPAIGDPPLPVTFVDQSAGSPTSWKWYFGDGDSSDVQHPGHMYDTAGEYDVTLYVSDGTFTDSLTKLSYVRVDTAFADLAASLWCLGARPGFDCDFVFEWSNLGTQPAVACTLKILPPPQLEPPGVIWVYDESSGGVGTYSGFDLSGDTMIVPLETINPSSWQGGGLALRALLPDTVPLGDTLLFSMWLSTPTNESVLTNNSETMVIEVTGSIDPNDKLAYPGGKSPRFYIARDQRLSYLIQFENKPEATAEAIYVRVVDTLDPDLDWGTLKVEQLSHPDDCTWMLNPHTGVLTVMCDSIMLPPNVNPPEGEGYVVYSISPRKDLADETEIENACYIRFDYNEWLQGPEYGPIVRIITSDCCIGDRGNVDNDPLDAVGLGDLTRMIDYLFVSFRDLDCWEEGNLDASVPEGPGSISLGDLTQLIDHLFISFKDLVHCP